MNRRQILKATAVILGAGLSGSLSRNVMAGLVPAKTAVRSLVDTQSRKMIAVLAELIIPRTDTPGAIEAGTPDFIEMMVSDWFNDGERRIFFDGLKALDEFCRAHYQKEFMACADTQRVAALKDAEASAAKYKSSVPAMDMSQKEVDPNTPFFTKLKELTVLGYLTSEVGSKQFLSYNPMPMRYDGDYGFDEAGRQWSW